MDETPRHDDDSPVPHTFAGLRRAVCTTLVVGQQDMEATKLLTYWRTGRLILGHVLLHAARAGYGEQVVPRLARAENLDLSLLRRCVQFAREYPILAARRQLGWGHYRVLIQVKDLGRRRTLELEANRHGWTCDRLEDRVRALNRERRREAAAKSLPSPAVFRGETSTSAAPPAPDATAPVRLKARRGTPGIHRIAAGPDGPAVDLGLANFDEIPPAQAGEFALGNLIRYDAGRRLVPAPEATTRDLYTYSARRLRVVDGDTIWLWLRLGPGRWLREKVRLRGIDCPELSTAAGRDAQRFVQVQFDAASAITVTTSQSDKYDRYLADVHLTQPDGTELFLNNALLEAGHAGSTDTYAFEEWEK
jgi:endonuclease YncB( thermonuclease family)